MLTVDDISTTISKENYVQAFRNLCLKAVATPLGTYVFMERYAHINGYAGSGVALLSGVLGYRRDAFLDAGDGVSRDRGMMIASKIFAATVDEHGSEHGNAPHRNLAQACVAAVAKAGGIDASMRKLVEPKSKSFLVVVERFKRNYSGEINNINSLVKSIGYHIASEYLADQEYQILDEEIWFRNPNPAFRSAVNRTQDELGKWGGVWMWITVHGHYGESAADDGHGVEQDHFEYAMKALNLVERFRPSGMSAEELKILIVEGLREFEKDFLDMFFAVDAEITSAVAQHGSGHCAS